jgi:hypothetical protein
MNEIRVFYIVARKKNEDSNDDIPVGNVVSLHSTAVMKPPYAVAVSPKAKAIFHRRPCE